MMKARLPAKRRFGSSKAFTFVELAVVAVILAILAAILWPALAVSRVKGEASQCLNNHKQLITAFKAYSDANLGNFPGDENGDQTVEALTAKVKPWANGWESYENGTFGSDTNTQFLINPVWASMGPYVQKPRFFKCPADPSCQFGAAGLPRVRSVSMNQAVGCALDGTENGIGENLSYGTGNWRIYPKESAVTEPTPVNLFIFADETPDSINDTSLAVQTATINDNSAEWLDAPSPLHVAAGSFSFADGHADLHAWRDPQWKTVLHDPPNYANYSLRTAVGINSTVDLRWLGEHTSAQKPGFNPWPWTYVPGP